MKNIKTRTQKYHLVNKEDLVLKMYFIATTIGEIITEKLSLRMERNDSLASPNNS